MRTPSASRGAGAARGAGGGEDGRITVLVCGLLVVILSLICVITAATQVTTGQRRVMALADAAAAASLESFEVVSGQGGLRPGEKAGAGQRLRITPERARRAAAEFLAQAPRPGGVEDLRIASVTVADDGVSVRVELEAAIRPGLTAGILPLRVGVEAAGWARLGLSE